MTDLKPGIDFPFTVWKVANMERKLDELGTVYVVHYTVTHFRDGEQAGAYGSIGLEAPEPDTGTPYPQLTEEVVVGWVTSHFGDEKVAEIIAALDDQITEKLAPTHSAGVPWG
jgi:ATP-dependent DNA ligase